MDMSKIIHMARLIVLTIICIASFESMSVKGYDLTDGVLYYNKTSASTLKVVGKPTDYYWGHIVVPEKFKDYSVTEIGESAFRGNGGLHSVVLSDAIIKIGHSAFNGQNQLTTINLGNGVKEIQQGAFRECSDLRSIRIPGSVRLFDLSVPGNVSGPDSYHMFYGSHLNTITFEYGKSELKWGGGKYGRISYTLYGHGNKIIAPKNVIVNRDIKLDVTGCSNITFGSKVKTVDICNTEDLQKIVCYATTPPLIETNFNYSQFTSIKILVPNEVVETYLESDTWGKFWNIEGFGAPSGVESISVSEDVSEIARYDINGCKVSDKYKGIVIVIYSDGTRKKIAIH